MGGQRNHSAAVPSFSVRFDLRCCSTWKGRTTKRATFGYRSLAARPDGDGTCLKCLWERILLIPRCSLGAQRAVERDRLSLRKRAVNYLTEWESWGLFTSIAQAFEVMRFRPWPERPRQVRPVAQVYRDKRGASPECSFSCIDSRRRRSGRLVRR